MFPSKLISRKSYFKASTATPKGLVPRQERERNRHDTWHQKQDDFSKSLIAAITATWQMPEYLTPSRTRQRRPHKSSAKRYNAAPKRRHRRPFFADHVLNTAPIEYGPPPPRVSRYFWQQLHACRPRWHVLCASSSSSSTAASKSGATLAWSSAPTLPAWRSPTRLVSRRVAFLKFVEIPRAQGVEFEQEP